MRRFPCKKGVTLIEMVIALAISVLAMGILWKGVLFLQSTLSQQMRLDRMSQVLILTQEISKSIREAGRIVSVGPDHLELETYNHAAYNLLDPRLYEQLKRVRYQFHAEEQSTSLTRDVYISTDATKPENSTRFLKNVDLMIPTETDPFFFARYLVGTSTMGVSVELGLHPPFSKERWVPIKEEVYVQAQ